MKEKYQKLYKRLFDLIMNNQNPTQQNQIRREMDKCQGTDEEKKMWGEEIGGKLYHAHLNLPKLHNKTSEP